jgi:hypothetical protein
MKIIGSVSIKMISVIMIMFLLLSAVPVLAAPDGEVGQDETPPVPEQGGGAAEPSQLLDDGISQAAAGASISGQITRNGVGMAGVTISDGSNTTITNTSGNYVLSGYGLGSTVTLSPTKVGYIFSPSSQIVTIGNGDVTGINFSATAVASTFSISGTVKLNGSGLAGVTVTATSNGNVLVGDTVTAGSKTATTNSKGGYLLSGLAAGSYTVTPTKTGYTFTPTKLTFTLGPNATGKNFSASAVPSGFVSQFQGSMAGWNKVSAIGWKVNNNYLYSLDLGRNTYVSAFYSPLSFSRLDYSVRLMRTGCNGCATSIYVRGTGVSAFGNWTQGYQFSITRSGNYLVAKNVFAKLVPIQNWKASPYIVKNSGWNVLRVVASDTSLQFYINGHLVWSGTNSAFSSGKVGFGISSNSTGGVNRLYIDYATLTMP